MDPDTHGIGHDTALQRDLIARFGQQIYDLDTHGTEHDTALQRDMIARLGL